MTQIKEARIMNVRNFRAELSRIAEPVIVVADGEIKGSWTPGTDGIEMGVVHQISGLMTDLRGKVTPAPAFGASGVPTDQVMVSSPEYIVPNPDPTSVVRSATDTDFIRPTSQRSAQRNAASLMELQRKALGASAPKPRKGK